MSNHKKRVYNSDTRQAKAAQTKTRILLCAKQLFQAHGYEPVTIEHIAKSAEVSLPTIYALYKSKLGILRILMDEALPLDQHDTLVKQARQEKCVKQRLHIIAKIARQLYDAERTHMRIFQGVSVLAPAFKELEQEKERRRHDRLTEAIKAMKEEQSLTQEMSLCQAHDILWALTGRDMYRMLVIEQGWTSDAYETWLTQFLVKFLVHKSFLTINPKALYGG